MNKPVTVYGADWCGDTRLTRSQLKSLDVPFTYVNVDTDPAGAAWVLEQNGGKRKLPTVDVAGKVLSVPDEETMEQALRDAGIGG